MPHAKPHEHEPEPEIVEPKPAERNASKPLPIAAIAVGGALAIGGALTAVLVWRRGAKPARKSSGRKRRSAKSAKTES